MSQQHNTIMRIFQSLAIALVLPTVALAQTFQNEAVHFVGEIPAISAFGTCVALDGDWLAVGDIVGYRPATPDLSEGSVDLFKRTESGWELHQRIFSPLPGHGDSFGRRVSLDAENGQLLVGNPGWSRFRDNPGSPYFLSGRAFLFELNGGQWTHSLTLRPLVPHNLSNPGTDAGTFRQQQFGYSVDIEGDRMAVGAPFAASLPPFAEIGLVYVYKKVAGQWAIDHIIEPPPIDWGFKWSWFGTRLDLDGDRLVVSGYGNTQGMVFLFEDSPSGWQLQAHFDSPLPGIGFVSRQFGYSVSLDGDRLAVGMPSWDCSNATCPSLVAIFEKQGQAWVRTQVLDEINSEPGNGHGVFGTDIKLKGDYLLASLPGQNNSGTPRGEARLYKYQAGQGFQLQTVYRHRNRPLFSNSLLGMEVDADFERGIIVAGDPNYQYSSPNSAGGNGWAAGAVLMFDMEQGQDLDCPGTSNTFGVSGHLSVIGSLNVADQNLTLHASQIPPGQLALFLYGLSGTPFNVTSGGQLCIQGGIHRMLPAGLIGEWGERILDVDLQLPREARNLLPGTTWAFQVWHRDSFPGLPAFTGTTNAVEVLLR